MTYRQQGQDRRQLIQERAILHWDNSALYWQNTNRDLQIIPGGTDFSILADYKDSIQKLWKQFFEGRSSIDMKGMQGQLIRRRLFQLQHEVEGLLKRRIHLLAQDPNGVQRVLDYSKILNEKENQIVQLEKKIQNLEQRLRRASQRQLELESQIQRLKTTFVKLERPGISRADIDIILKGSLDYKTLQQKYNSLRDRLGAFYGLIKAHSERIKPQSLEFEADLLNLVRAEGVNVSIVNGVVNIVEHKDRVVQVPVSDVRIKSVIHMFAVQVKNILTKYPKLKEQFDIRLIEFFQQEVIDCIEVDQMSKILQIVKYVPDVYRVENVYAYSSEKSRRVQFHLRVLLKALLQELTKIKTKLGVVLDLDEGVIEMIRTEIMDFVDIDDILKVFRVVPKIVQVQKVIERVVQKVVEVPKTVPVQTCVEKVIIQKDFLQIQKVVHVPVQINKYVDVCQDRIVYVDRIVEKIIPVEVIKEVLVEKIVQVKTVQIKEVIVQVPVECKVIEIVQKIIHVPVKQCPEIVTKQIEKIVPCQTIQQKCKPVDVYIDRIVPCMIQIPKIECVKIIEEVPIINTQYRIQQNTVHIIEKVPQEIPIQTRVPVCIKQQVQRIKQVPRIIEKPIHINTETQVPIQVEVCVEKIVCNQVVIQKIIEVQKIVEVCKQVEKIVYVEVQVPFFIQVCKIVPEIITKIQIQKTTVTKIVQVQVCKEKIVEVCKVIPIEVIRHVPIQVQVPVPIYCDKLAVVQKVVERIKQVRVNIDKIIQKIVEVPKVVEVQKIVQKVVCVPRIVQKVVVVPQFIEKIVQRIVQVPIIEKVCTKEQVPIIQKVFKEYCKQIIVQKEKIVPVQICIQKVVPCQKIIEEVRVCKEVIQKVVQCRVEVPRQLIKQRAVICYQEVVKQVPVKQQVCVPVKKCVEVQRKVQKIVPVLKIQQKPVYVDLVKQKIVQCQRQKKICQPVQVIKQVIVIHKQYQKVYQKQYCIETKHEICQIKEQLPPVPVPVVHQKICEVQKIVQKLVTQIHQRNIPFTVQAIVNKIVCQEKFIKVCDEYPVPYQQILLFEKDKLIPVQTVVTINNCKQCERVIQKPVKQKEIITQYAQIEKYKEKVCQVDRFIKVIDKINHIRNCPQIVQVCKTEYITIQLICQKILQIPYILEKVVQRIVVMPQVVQILKYVHEITQKQTLGVVTDVSIYQHQAKYKGLYSILKVQFNSLLNELRKMRTSNPNLKVQIQAIQSYLSKLDAIIAFPKFVQIQKQRQKQVEKKVPILVPTTSVQSQRFQITMALIIGKLVRELTRIKESNPNLKLNIDVQILKIFSNEQRSKHILPDNIDFNEKLRQIYKMYENFLQNLGGSQLSHQQKLIYTAALEQRLLVSSLITQANDQIKKAKKALELQSRQIRQTLQLLRQINDKANILFNKINPSKNPQLKNLMQQILGLLRMGTNSGYQLGKSISRWEVYGDTCLTSQQGDPPHLHQLCLSDPNFFIIFERKYSQVQIHNKQLLARYKQLLDTLSQQRIRQLEYKIKQYQSQPLKLASIPIQAQRNLRQLAQQNIRLQNQLAVVRSQLQAKTEQLQAKNKQIQELWQKVNIGSSRSTTYDANYTPSGKVALQNLGQSGKSDNAGGFSYGKSSGSLQSPSDNYGRSSYGPSSSGTDNQPSYGQQKPRYSYGGNTTTPVNPSYGQSAQNVKSSYSGSSVISSSGASTSRIGTTGQTGYVQSSSVANSLTGNTGSGATNDARASSGGASSAISYSQGSSYSQNSSITTPTIYGQQASSGTTSGQTGSTTTTYGQQGSSATTAYSQQSSNVQTARQYTPTLLAGTSGISSTTSGTSTTGATGTTGTTQAGSSIQPTSNIYSSGTYRFTQR